MKHGGRWLGRSGKKAFGGPSGKGQNEKNGTQTHQYSFRHAAAHVAQMLHMYFLCGDFVGVEAPFLFITSEKGLLPRACTDEGARRGSVLEMLSAHPLEESSVFTCGQCAGWKYIASVMGPLPLQGGGWG